jgi:hypothetical protein
VITVAALCPSPPLLHPALTGRDAVLPELREACAQAASRLLRDNPGEIVVVGSAAATGEWDAAGRLDAAAFAPAPGRGAGGVGSQRQSPGSQRQSPGSQRQSPGSQRQSPGSLPLSLGLGAMLLDQAGFDGRRRLIAVGQDEPASACARLGAALNPATGAASGSGLASGAASGSGLASGTASGAGAASGTASGSRAGLVPGRMALLVMGDGSARRSLKAPGYLDPRAAAFDAEVERAVRAGDLDALLRLDQALARDLMATGRPAWQVLAGAMQSLTPVSEVLYCGDPFGVAYLVASLRPTAARSLSWVAFGPQTAAGQLVRCGIRFRTGGTRLRAAGL